MKRDRNYVASDLKSDKRRHMTCPSNPPTLQDSTNIFSFCLCSFCNKVSAWSCLLWHYVSLLCHSGLGLAWRFHALFSATPFLPLRTMGHHLRILPFFIFGCLCTLLTFAQINLSCSYSLLPFIFKFSFMLSLFVITLSRPPLLLRASTSISGSPCCLLGMVSCHLCRMTWATSCVYSLAHTAHINIKKNIWDITQVKHALNLLLFAASVCFVSVVNIKTIVIVSPELNLCLTSLWQRHSQYFSTEGNTFDWVSLVWDYQLCWKRDKGITNLVETSVGPCFCSIDTK